MTEYDIADDHARKAVAWAAGTIALYAPHLELRPSRHGWDVWWRADEGFEPQPLKGAQGLDWSGLCQFARRVLEER